ncbi:MAG: hypothetical protein OCD76_21705 [Reichenbachiella sp.]
MSKKRIISYALSSNMLLYLSLVVILVISIVPLFFDLPFRDNIYLSWEGAYRMYQGQVPFKDFGLPLGYMYWVLPTLSFYIFGPYLFSLVKMQVFINIISGLSFMSIAHRFSKDKGLVLIAVSLYVISFSFYNFWPWYNHSVVVYEFIGLAILVHVLSKQENLNWRHLVSLSISALFCFASFFTKQDGGAFALLLSGSLLLYYSFLKKDWKCITVFGVSYIIIAFCFIFPLAKYEFSYWFNYGQFPHYSRMSLSDVFSVFMAKSSFIKLYLIIILLIILSKSRNGFSWLLDYKFSIHLILTLGILVQATVLQVTSYVPVDGNIYFHPFMILFILNNIPLELNYAKIKNLVPVLFLVFIWWSGRYWDYASRMFPELFTDNNSQEKVISINTFSLSKDTTILDKSIWKVSNEKVFEGVKMPLEVISSIDSLKEWRSRQSGEIKVLNMSELTPLAEVLDYKTESRTPLWFHLNVAIFDRELDVFKKNIIANEYDLVLFERIPDLNNFYPFEIHEELKNNYQLWFSFQAPRETTLEVIEVYLKKVEGND